MHRVYEMVKREAERYGAMPVGSEIVGWSRRKPIEMAADYFLQFENFSPAQVFENKLEAALSGHRHYKRRRLWHCHQFGCQWPDADLALYGVPESAASSLFQTLAPGKVLKLQENLQPSRWLSSGPTHISLHGHRPIALSFALHIS